MHVDLSSSITTSYNFMQFVFEKYVIVLYFKEMPNLILKLNKMDDLRFYIVAYKYHRLV